MEERADIEHKIECNLEQKDNKRLNRKNIISYGMIAITESEFRSLRAHSDRQIVRAND